MAVDLPGSPGGALEARAVTVRFGGVTALDGVSLALQRGEILGLIGPNGAGKTTLVNVLTGFQRVASGEVVLDGSRVVDRRPFQVARSGLGRTFQAARLFDGLTVLENVELGAMGAVDGRPAARDLARETLDWIGLADRADRIAGELPHGEKRWVGLARALAGRPRFLLLDEPAAGLSESEADALLDAVVRIRATFGCGVLVVEHNMRLVMALCDRIHVLAQGRTIAEGDPETVRADAGVRRAYLGEPPQAGEQSPVPRPAPPRRETLLAVRDLHVQYGQVPALRGVSIEVGDGELVSIVGPNGAGKSTLLATIAGVVPAARGTITFAGRSLAGTPVEQVVARGLSLVPEGRHVFPALSVRENLVVGATTRRDRLTVAQDLDRLLDLFPILRERADTPAGKLSGGEQQQLAIARALLARPRLLMLDEPSLGLAPLVIDAVYATLEEIRRQGISILLVEQNAHRALEASDRTYVLSSGVIQLQGLSGDLVGHPTFERAYFGGAGRKAS